MTLHLPDELMRSINLTEAELRLELAIALYASKKLSFGQARKLADLNWFRFRQLLDERKVPAHYEEEDFEQDQKGLLQFAGLFDQEDLDDMKKAIEDCGRIEDGAQITDLDQRLKDLEEGRQDRPLPYRNE